MKEKPILVGTETSEWRYWVSESWVSESWVSESWVSESWAILLPELLMLVLFPFQFETLGNSLKEFFELSGGSRVHERPLRNWLVLQMASPSLAVPPLGAPPLGAPPLGAPSVVSQPGQFERLTTNLLTTNAGELYPSLYGWWMSRELGWLE